MRKKRWFFRRAAVSDRNGDDDKCISTASTRTPGAKDYTVLVYFIKYRRVYRRTGRPAHKRTSVMCEWVNTRRVYARVWRSFDDKDPTVACGRIGNGNAERIIFLRGVGTKRPGQIKTRNDVRRPADGRTVVFNRITRTCEKLFRVRRWHASDTRCFQNASVWNAFTLSRF